MKKKRTFKFKTYSDAALKRTLSRICSKNQSNVIKQAMKNFCDVGTVVLHLLKCLSVKNTDGSADTKMRYTDWLQNEPR